jgi:hypothetical protein
VGASAPADLGVVGVAAEAGSAVGPGWSTSSATGGASSAAQGPIGYADGTRCYARTRLPLDAAPRTPHGESRIPTR